MHPKNIALTGRSGSGKTSVAEYLIDTHGYIRVGTGDVCRQVCKLLFNDESKGILIAVTDALKAIDNNVWINAALRNAPTDRPLVFDSMRFNSDFDQLVARGFTTLRTESQQELRHRRLRERGQHFELKDDEHASENESDSRPVDLTLINDGTLPELFQKIEDAITSLPSSST